MAEPSRTDEPVPLPQSAAVERVGQTLRRVYDEAASEPVPEAFEELLRRLR